MADINLANGRTASTTGQETAFAVVQWAKRRLRFELSEQLEEFLERKEKAPIRARRAEDGWRLLRGAVEADNRGRACLCNLANVSLLHTENIPALFQARLSCRTIKASPSRCWRVLFHIR